MKRAFHSGPGLMRQRGVAGLMAMIFLLVVVSLAAVTLLSMSSSDLHDTTAQNEGIAALFAAETGIERASELYATGTPCGATLLPPPAPAAPMAINTRASFQSTTTAPVSLAGPTRCRLQVVGRVGKTTRTIQAELGTTPIAFVAASGGTTNSTSLTWSHTIPATAGANRVLIVGVSIRRTAAAQQVLLVPPIVAPRYGAQTLTFLNFMNHPTGGVRVELFYLVNPPIGTAIVVINLSAAADASGGAVTLSGVNQVTPMDVAAVFTNGVGTTSSVTVTPVTDNAWVVDTLGSRMLATATVGPGQTQRWSGSIGAILGAGSTEGPKTPVGPVVMSWTLSASQSWVAAAVALRPHVYVLNWVEM